MPVVAARNRLRSSSGSAFAPVATALAWPDESFPALYASVVASSPSMDCTVSSTPMASPTLVPDFAANHSAGDR